MADGLVGEKPVCLPARLSGPYLSGVGPPRGQFFYFLLLSVSSRLPVSPPAGIRPDGAPRWRRRKGMRWRITHHGFSSSAGRQPCDRPSPKCGPDLPSSVSLPQPSLEPGYLPLSPSLHFSFSISPEIDRIGSFSLARSALSSPSRPGNFPLSDSVMRRLMQPGHLNVHLTRRCIQPTITER